MKARGAGATGHLPVLLLCGFVMCLEGYDIAAIGYAIPPLVDTWHIKPPAFTSAIVAGNVGMLCGALLAGLLGDRFGRKPILIGSVTLFGTFSIGTACVGGLDGLTVLRFATGFGLGGGVPLAVALASDHAPSKVQGRMVILMSSGLSIGAAGGGLLASKLVPAFGWPAIFVLGGILPIALACLLWSQLPESRLSPRFQDRPNPVAALFRNGLAPLTILLWGMNLLSLLSNYLISLWLPAMLHSAGLVSSWAIFIGAMFPLGSVLGAYLTAPVVDRAGLERVLALIEVIGAAAVLVLGLFVLVPSVLAVAVCVAGIGIGAGQHGINALSGRVYPSDIRATGAGWAIGAGRLGMIIGPALGGGLLYWGWSAQQIFLVTAAPALCVALGATVVGWVRSRPASAVVPLPLQDVALK